MKRMALVLTGTLFIQGCALFGTSQSWDIRRLRVNLDNSRPAIGETVTFTFNDLRPDSYLVGIKKVGGDDSLMYFSTFTPTNNNSSLSVQIKAGLSELNGSRMFSIVPGNSYMLGIVKPNELEYLAQIDIRQ